MAKQDDQSSLSIQFFFQHGLAFIIVFVISWSFVVLRYDRLSSRECSYGKEVLSDFSGDEAT